MTFSKQFPAVAILILLVLLAGTVLAAAAPTPGQGQQVPPGQPVQMPGQPGSQQAAPPGAVPPGMNPPAAPASGQPMNLVFWQTVHDYSGKLVSKPTLDDVYAKTRKLYNESPNYGFFLFLVPAELKGQKTTMDSAVMNILDLPEIKNDVTTKIALVIYMTETHEYKVIMDEWFKKRANLALVQSIMDEQFVPRMKEGKADEAVATVVPRLAANYSLFLRNADNVDQTSVRPAGYNVRANVFGFKAPPKPQTIAPPAPVKAPPPPPSTPWYMSWWVLGPTIAILACILGYRLWNRFRDGRG